MKYIEYSCEKLILPGKEFPRSAIQRIHPALTKKQGEPLEEALRFVVFIRPGSSDRLPVAPRASLASPYGRGGRAQRGRRGNTSNLIIQIIQKRCFSHLAASGGGSAFVEPRKACGCGKSGMLSSATGSSIPLSPSQSPYGDSSPIGRAKGLYLFCKNQQSIKNGAS